MGRKIETRNAEIMEDLTSAAGTFFVAVKSHGQYWFEFWKTGQNSGMGLAYSKKSTNRFIIYALQWRNFIIVRPLMVALLRAIN